MNVKKQHYVPQVYLKAWETQVVSKKEPEKPFKGIYFYYKEDLSIGDGRNKATVLHYPRLYNVNYEISFIIPSCPEIRKDYIDQISKKLKEREVYAFYDGKKLRTLKELAENFLKIDDWEYKNIQYPFRPASPAKKNVILNNLKQTNSYVIENALSDVIETKWEKALKDFINKMNSTIPLNGIDEIRRLDKETVIEIVRMVIFLICRNPKFDCMGVYTNIENNILKFIPQDKDQKFAKNQIDALWIKELYNGLFNVPRGFFIT